MGPPRKTDERKSGVKQETMFKRQRQNEKIKLRTNEINKQYIFFLKYYPFLLARARITY